MNVTTEPTKFTDTEGEELVAYRPVNRWAVVTVVFGLLSVATMFHPMFLFVPVLGFVCAILAARQLLRPESNQTGRGALNLGLFLCLVFGSCTTTIMVYRQQRLEGQARAFSEKWLDLFRQGKSREAHQLTLSDEKRVAAGGSLEQYYAPPGNKPLTNQELDHLEADPSEMMDAPPHTLLSVFLRKPIVERLIQLGNQANYEFVETISREPIGSNGTTIQQRFRVRYGDSHEFFIRLYLDRSLLNRVAIWKITVVDERPAS